MNKTLRFTLLVLGLAFAVAASAHAAATANVEVTKPLGAGTVVLTFTSNGVTQTVTVPVTASDSAKTKCEKIQAKLTAQGFEMEGECPNFKIKNLTNGTTVTFDPGKTGENKDQVTMAKTDGTAPPASAAIGFLGTFNGIGGDRRPATFTAGVVTGAGSVAVTYTPGGALVIPGHQIAAQLHEMLTAAVEEAGLEVFLFHDGDGTILIEYGPGDGKEERGVIFGTTATNRGVVGTVSTFD